MGNRGERTKHYITSNYHNLTLQNQQKNKKKNCKLVQYIDQVKDHGNETEWLPIMTLLCHLLFATTTQIINELCLLLSYIAKKNVKICELQDFNNNSGKKL